MAEDSFLDLLARVVGGEGRGFLVPADRRGPAAARSRLICSKTAADTGSDGWPSGNSSATPIENCEGLTRESDGGTRSDPEHAVRSTEAETGPSHLFAITVKDATKGVSREASGRPSASRVILSFRLKTVFLTGATGFVGSHAASRFLAAGWRVRALVRRPDRPGLLPAGVEAITGDLTTIPAAAIEGADAVVHAAGITTATSRSGFFDVNARGTETLARAAAAASPGAKFVLVSSQSAVGPSRDGRPVAESDPPRPVSWYGESKLEGELALERVWKGSWTIVRPSVVYGSGDPGMLQLFAVIARGRRCSRGACRIQLIWAGDVCPRRGRRSGSARRGFAAGPAVTTRELALFAGSLRRPAARMLPIPAFAIRAAGVLESVREAITRKSRPFNRDKAREILQPDWVCDAEPFLRDVGIEDLRPWKEGIAETLAWYQREGWLHASFGEL